MYLYDFVELTSRLSVGCIIGLSKIKWYWTHRKSSKLSNDENHISISLLVFDQLRSQDGAFFIFSLFWKFIFLARSKPNNIQMADPRVVQKCNIFHFWILKWYIFKKITALKYFGCEITLQFYCREKSYFIAIFLSIKRF